MYGVTTKVLYSANISCNINWQPFSYDDDDKPKDVCKYYYEKCEDQIFLYNIVFSLKTLSLLTETSLVADNGHEIASMMRDYRTHPPEKPKAWAGIIFFIQRNLNSHFSHFQFQVWMFNSLLI